MIRCGTLLTVSRRGRIALGIVAVLGGCIEIHPFQQPASIDAGMDGAPDAEVLPSACNRGGVATFTEGTKRAVCGPGYVTRFSDVAYRFPSSLAIAGTETLTDGDACAAQDGFGIELAPVGSLSGHTPRAVGQQVNQADLTVELDTPFVVKISLDWAATFACGVAPHGRTTFAFFEGGRIVRYDHVQIAAGSMATTCHDACTPSASTWNLGSYLTLTPPTGTTITHTGVPALGGSVMIPDLSGEVCVDHPGYRVGLSWFDPQRRVVQRPIDPALAFVQSLIALGQMTLPAVDANATSFLQVDGTRTIPCANLEATLAPWRSDPQLGVKYGGGMTGIGIGNDGIFGGEYATGTHGLGAGTGDTTLTAIDAIPPASVVWLVYAQHYATFTFTDLSGSPLAANSVEWAAIPGTNGVLVYLRDGIAKNAGVLVKPS